MKNSALILIDTQMNMFAPDPVHNADSLLDTLQSLLAEARSAKAVVVHIQNNGGPGDPDEPNTPGWAIHPQLSPTNDELVIQKETPDAFKDTPLQAKLNALGVDKLVIGGMQTEMCINATIQKAASLGYKVILVEDGHSTFDFEGESATETITQHNHDLATIVDVSPAQSIQFGS